MGTMASRPASSASFADASVFCHVGMRISGTKLMLGIVFVQKVPSFSLLELKMGFVELLVTRVILPEISRITQSVEPVGSGHVATLPADFPRVYIRQNDPLARITESVIHGFHHFFGRVGDARAAAQARGAMPSVSHLRAGSCRDVCGCGVEIRGAKESGDHRFG